MGAIIPFLRDEAAAFDPTDIQAMSMALDDVCEALNLSADADNARETIAVRIIELARLGERSVTLLRDRVLERGQEWHYAVTAERDPRILVAEARIARQRELIAHLEARGSDTSEAKSMLSGMRYSLRLLKQHQRRAQRSGPVTRVAGAARDLGGT